MKDNGSPTTRAVRAIDNQIRLIDEQLCARAEQERRWNGSPHVLARIEESRRRIGAMTSAALIEQRKQLECEREDLLADREDYAADHGRYSLDEQLERAERHLDMYGDDL